MNANATPRRIENVQTDRGSLPVYATGTVEQPWDSYSASDHAVWQQLYKRQREILPGRASDAFLHAQDTMGMTPDRIPKFSDLNRVLGDATGLDTDVERTSHPLLAQLRDSGLVSADPLGLGVRASAQCELLDRRGMPVRGLYGLGPLLRGQSWEMTAVPELRIAARQLADQLLRRQRSTATASQETLRARVS